MSYATTMTTDALLRVILAWLVQSYPLARIPVGLIHRSLAPPLQAGPAQIDDAIRTALDRGFMQQHAMSSDGAVVSLTPKGVEQGNALVAAVQSQLGSGRLTPAGKQTIDELTGKFRETLERTAAVWARSASSDVEPIHVVMAGRALAAGALTEAIDRFDRARDKTRDGPAERKLLELLFQQAGRGAR